MSPVVVAQLVRSSPLSGVAVLTWTPGLVAPPLLAAVLVPADRAPAAPVAPRGSRGRPRRPARRDDGAAARARAEECTKVRRNAGTGSLLGGSARLMVSSHTCQLVEAVLSTAAAVRGALGHRCDTGTCGGGRDGQSGQREASARPCQRCRVRSGLGTHVLPASVSKCYRGAVIRASRSGLGTTLAAGKPMALRAERQGIGDACRRDGTGGDRTGKDTTQRQRLKPPVRRPQRQPGLRTSCTRWRPLRHPL